MSTDIHALVGAYVVDAVDDLERAAFERHLAECAACAVEVEELREAAVRLADPTWSVPPPELRTRVMAEIARTRQVGPVVPRAAASPRRLPRFLLTATAAVVLVAGAGVTSWAIQEQRVRSERAAATAARAEQARIQSVLSAPDVQLRSTALADGGRVTLAISPGRDAGVLMVSATTPPPADKSYQLWTQDGAAMNNAGVLAAGSGTATLVMEHVTSHNGIGVTLEPAGGSRQPTLPPKALIPLT